MKAKSVFTICLLALLAVTIFSCRSSKSSKDNPVIISGKRPASGSSASSSSTAHLPPGHAKKLNGDKSAKAYAPGQQKKKNKKKG
jgi:hypothetical protein